MSTTQNLKIKEELSKEVLLNALDEIDNSDIEETDKYVMKELLTGDIKDIKFKTELNFTQITGIVKLLSLDKIMKAQSNLDTEEALKELESVPVYMTQLMMELLVSKDRMGRKEFIKAWIGNKSEKFIDRLDQWTEK